jgi:hypothetical protein
MDVSCKTKLLGYRIGSDVRKTLLTQGCKYIELREHFVLTI